MSGNLKRLNKTEEGDKIVALISHCNKDLNEEDRIVNLINDGDGWHFLDLDFNRTHEQLSWNWDIIDFRLLKIEKLQKQNKILMEALERIEDKDTCIVVSDGISSKYKNYQDGWQGVSEFARQAISEAKELRDE